MANTFTLQFPDCKPEGFTEGSKFLFSVAPAGFYIYPYAQNVSANVPGNPGPGIFVAKAYFDEASNLAKARIDHNKVVGGHVAVITGPFTAGTATTNTKPAFAIKTTFSTF